MALRTGGCDDVHRAGILSPVDRGSQLCLLLCLFCGVDRSTIFFCFTTALRSEQSSFHRISVVRVVCTGSNSGVSIPEAGEAKD